MTRMPYLSIQASRLRLSRCREGDEARRVAREVTLEVEGSLVDANTTQWPMSDGRAWCVLYNCHWNIAVVASRAKLGEEMAAYEWYLWQQVCRPRSNWS